MPCEPLKHAVRILISDLFVPMSLKRQKLHFFSGLISTTKFNSVYFIAMRISYIHFFTAVHLYDFHISTIIIHHLDGLFGCNLMTSSSAGRVLHCYRRGHGFKSRMGLNFFQVLFQLLVQ